MAARYAQSCGGNNPGDNGDDKKRNVDDKLVTDEDNEVILRTNLSKDTVLVLQRYVVKYTSLIIIM